MDEFSRRIENFILKHDLIRPDEKLLVAVSGGPDSFALLHFLLERYKENVSIAHLDHALRVESIDEKEYLEQFAKEQHVPFYSKRVDIKKLQAEMKMTFEEAARHARYAFFESIVAEQGFDKLVLAHHADDQVETILMRLVRGSFGSGYAGMRAIRPFSSGKLIRPFLEETKETILTYAQAAGLHYFVDETNDSPLYTRNRYRRELLPFLKKENPRVAEHFARFSAELQEDMDFLDELAKQKFAEFGEVKSSGVELQISGIKSAAFPLQRRLIHLLLNYLYKNAEMKEISARNVQDILELVESDNPSAKLNLPKGLEIRRVYERIEGFFPVEQKNQEFYYQMEAGDRIVLRDGSELKMRQKSSSVETSGLDGIIVNADEVTLPLIVRTRLPGDKMKLKGSGGTKKIKEILITEKVPRHLRDSIPIVTDFTGRILWIPGIKKSNQDTKPSREKKQYIIRYRKNLGGKMSMHDDIQKVLISEERIQEKIRELGVELTTEYEGRNPLVIGILKGATPFMTDLLKRIDTYLEMDFMDVSSYGNGMVSSGEVKIIKDLNTSVEGREVLVVEDIVDSGRTLSYLVEMLKYRKAKSVKLVTLLDKPEGRNVDIHADYVGFVVPNEFVVGYGLDFAEKYRNLPYIGILKPEIYAE